jgi:diguanylate cyclase (GGDEF)-like protein
MRIWASQAGVGARVGRLSGVASKAVGLLLLVGLVFVLPMGVTLQLKHSGERGLEAERNLQAVMTELQVQDGLEWRVISGRVPPREVRAALHASRDRSRVLLSSFARHDGDTVDTAHRTVLVRDYTQAVDEQLRLLSAGRAQQALRVDEQRVDPAFELAMADMVEDAARTARQGAHDRRFSDGGILITVLLSLALTTVVQSRRRRANVRRNTERRGEARYRALVDESSDLVLVTDRSGVARFLSPSAERLLRPTSSDQPVGAVSTGPICLLPAVSPGDRAGLLAALQAAGPGRGSTVEIRIPSADETRTFEVTVVDLTGEASVGGLVLTAHDVTDRIAFQAELEHRALHDTLTGLPNRALLADRFERALSSSRRGGTATGLLLIDLDRFKEINDTFGHHYGDALLTQVGPRLAGVLRDVDTVARLGGDEFAVLLPDVHTVHDVTAVAVKLRAALQAPFHVAGVDLDVDASIGAVLSGEHGNDPSSLLQRADIAMYVAKSRNLDMFVYDPAVDGHSPAKLALLGDLRRALDLGQLLLHYQPKVSIGTGEVVGVEALVRWAHPDRGLLFPDAFIPLAEHTGLIGPLTRYVLDAALAQARSWADAGQPLTVSVNLSARNLLEEHLPEQVADLLSTHGVPPELLELEVTESAIMTEPARAQQLLHGLAALGIRLSIDDFGAGYTSLGQLKTLPVTELKIDKSFVLTMTEDTSSALIVHSVIDLGHNLGLTLIAEGVETEEALTALAGYGCDLAQGYYLCKPISVDSFDTWRARHHPPKGPVTGVDGPPPASAVPVPS